MLDGEPAVAPGYPQSTARDWLVCRDSQADPEGAGAEAGAHAPPGQHDRSHSEDGYQVCACSSGASGPPWAWRPLLAATLLPPLSTVWRVARALAL